MARLVRGCPTSRHQKGGAEEPERDPHQEEQQNATESEDIADYDLDIDYVSSEPKVESVTQDEREVDPDAEYTNMEIPQDGTLCRG